MIGKLTMENYILKREKECILQKKKEDSSVITLAGTPHLLRWG